MLIPTDYLVMFASAGAIALSMRVIFRDSSPRKFIAINVILLTASLCGVLIIRQARGLATQTRGLETQTRGLEDTVEAEIARGEKDMNRQEALGTFTAAVHVAAKNGQPIQRAYVICTDCSRVLPLIEAFAANQDMRKQCDKDAGKCKAESTPQEFKVTWLVSASAKRESVDTIATSAKAYDWLQCSSVDEEFAREHRGSWIVAHGGKPIQVTSFDSESDRRYPLVRADVGEAAVAEFLKKVESAKPRDCVLSDDALVRSLLTAVTPQKSPRE